MPLDFEHRAVLEHHVAGDHDIEREQRIGSGVSGNIWGGNFGQQFGAARWGNIVRQPFGAAF